MRQKATWLILYAEYCKTKRHPELESDRWVLFCSFC